LLADGASNFGLLGPIETGGGSAGTATHGQVGNNDEPGQINESLVIGVHNGSSGDFTGGDAANTLQVSVYYNTLTIV
jgi:hypothetical protein